MEAQAQNKAPKKGSSFLIIVLVVLLLGLGVAGWVFLKPKEDQPDGSNNSNDDGGADSRNNTAGQYQGLTEDQITDLFGTNVVNNNTTQYQAGSKERPYFVNDPDFQALVTKQYELMQGHTETMDLIRNKYDTGKAIVTSQNADSLTAIKNLFAQRPLPDGTFPDMSAPKYWLYFPIYGTSEPNGLVYRTELQNFVSKGYEGYNLTNKRHSGNPWWLANMKLNLLVGTTQAATPSADDVWWGRWSHDQRQFYKGMNGHWVDDKLLTDIFVDKNNPTVRVDMNNPNARAAYAAGYMVSMVETWIREIDNLDKYTKIEAMRKLMLPKDKGGSGIYVSFLDPNNPNRKYYADYGFDEGYDPSKDTKAVIGTNAN